MLLNCSDIFVEMNFKDRFIIPEESFTLKNSVLKSNGYYYCKLTNPNFCEYKTHNNVTNPVQESKFTEKYIKTIIIYNDGSFYYPYNTSFSGIDKSATNFCNNVKKQNNYELAKTRYEKYIMNRLENNNRFNKGIFEKGVYNLYEDNIMIFQSYQGWPFYEYTIEHYGKILNDSTFVLELSKIYETNEIDILKDTFHFSSFDKIPKQSSYILKNRKKFGK